MIKKTVLFILVCVFCATPALAVTFAWDHADGNVLGFTIYFWETDAPETIYNKTIEDPAAREMEIEDTRFKPNIEYSFHATAYNLYGESNPSNEITWTRDVSEYTPPADKLPTEININAPGPVTININ